MDHCSEGQRCELTPSPGSINPSMLTFRLFFFCLFSFWGFFWIFFFFLNSESLLQIYICAPFHIHIFVSRAVGVYGCFKNVISIHLRSVLLFSAPSGAAILQLHAESLSKIKWQQVLSRTKRFTSLSEPYSQTESLTQVQMGFCCSADGLILSLLTVFVARAATRLVFSACRAYVLRSGAQK